MQSSSTNKMTMSTSNPPTNDKWIFYSDRFAAYEFQKQSYYEQNEHCDITLIAGKNRVKFHAHKIVLSAWSEYFFEEFQHENTAYHDPEGIDGSTLKLIVDFMYLGWIKLNLTNAESIVRTAAFLKMNILVDGCCDFMEQHVNNDNCLKWFSLSEELCLSALKDKCLKHIYINFEKISTHRELLLVNENVFKDLLVNANPHGDGDLEKCIFLAIVTWIEYDKGNRKHLACQLLSMVRYQFLTPTFILENCSPIGKAVEISEVVDSWLRMLSEARSNDKQECDVQDVQIQNKSCLNFQLDVAKTSSSILQFNSVPRKADDKHAFASSLEQSINPEVRDGTSKTEVDQVRLKSCSNTQVLNASVSGNGFDTQNFISSPRNEHGKLAYRPKSNVSTFSINRPICCVFDTNMGNGKLTVLCETSSETIIVQTYNSDKNSWSIEKQINSNEWNRPIFCSLIVINKKLVVVGGHIKGTAANCVRYLDLLTYKWNDLPPMTKPRECSKLSDVNGNLCVTGGDITDDINTTEVFNFLTHKWSVPIPRKRRNLTTHDIMFRGMNSCYEVIRRTYVSNNWPMEASPSPWDLILTHRIGLALLGEFLYIIGGGSHHIQYDCVYRYNLATRELSDVAPLPRKRSGVSTVVFENKILVFGGRPEGTWVDEYNPENNTWRSLSSLLPASPYTINIRHVRRNIN